MIQADVAARLERCGSGVSRTPMASSLRPRVRQTFRAMARFCRSRESREPEPNEFLICFADTGYLCEQRAAKLLSDFAPADRRRLAAAWVEIWVTTEAGKPHWTFWDTIPLRGTEAIPGRRRALVGASRIGAPNARKGMA